MYLTLKWKLWIHSPSNRDGSLEDRRCSSDSVVCCCRVLLYIIFVFFIYFIIFCFIIALPINMRYDDEIERTTHNRYLLLL